MGILEMVTNTILVTCENVAIDMKLYAKTVIFICLICLREDLRIKNVNF